MATFQPLHRHNDRGGICRRTLPLGAPASDRVLSACAPDIKGSFLFGIEVQQGPAFQQGWAQVLRTCQPGFLLNGEQQLQRAVLQGRVLHDGKGCRHSDAVVGAKRGSICHQHMLLADELDRVLQEVVHLVGVFLAHHVQMGLQAEATRPLPAGRRRFLHDDVAEGVSRRLQA